MLKGYIHPKNEMKSLTSTVGGMIFFFLVHITFMEIHSKIDFAAFSRTTEVKGDFFKCEHPIKRKHKLFHTAPPV